MAGSFHQIYIQIVFAVKGRQALISKTWEEQLYKYMTGIIQGKDQKMIAINGVRDHVHLLIGMKPTCCLSDLVREVKKSSNEFVNQHRLVRGKFNWQDGYGAFSYSHSDLDHVAQYVMNQKKHHRTKTFEEEYRQLLDEFQVPYKREYLFEWIDTPYSECIDDL